MGIRYRTQRFNLIKNTFTILSRCRFQDTHNQSFILVLASGRWLGTRLDLLNSLLIATVALGAVLMSQDAGTYIRVSLSRISFTQI